MLILTFILYKFCNLKQDIIWMELLLNKVISFLPDTVFFILKGIYDHKLI